MAAEAEEHTCLNCQSGSDSVVLLSCEYKGVCRWVCVRCLPMLIHGAH